MSQRMQRTSADVINKMQRRYGDDEHSHKHDKSKGKHYRRHQKTYLSQQSQRLIDLRNNSDNEDIYEDIHILSNQKAHGKRIRAQLGMKKSKKK